MCVPKKLKDTNRKWAFCHFLNYVPKEMINAGHLNFINKSQGLHEWWNIHFPFVPLQLVSYK
uniref:Uncharacterized protein n=1 Tax=Anguilla anguilla TaxID=7936 RepID=A0A0E9XDN0_ANGAN